MKRQKADTRRLLDRLLIAIAPAAGLCVPLLDVFGRLSIPVVAGPSLLVLSGMAAAGFVLGCAAAALLPHASSGLARRTAFAGALSLILIALVDVAFGGHRILDALVPSGIADGGLRRPARALSLAGLAAAAFFVSWVLRVHAARLIGIVSLAAFAATLGIAATRPGASRPPNLSRPVDSEASSAPIFLYIVLDEAAGIRALNGVPGGGAVATQTSEVLRRHGFRVYPRAFSRHVTSNRSIPNTLNFDFRDNTYGVALRHHTDLKVESRLFSRLAESGYEVASYGTAHIDLCFAVASSCASLQSFNPLNAFITNADARQSGLIHLVHSSFSQSYFVYHYTRLLSSREALRLPSGLLWFDLYAFPSWFDAVAADIEAASRGRAIFVHLLMPHAPYIYDAACNLTGRADVSYFLKEQQQLDEAAFESERAKRYHAYLDQYQCLVSKLDTFLTRLRNAPHFADATIVLQGDHGARISAGALAESLSQRDYIDNYSALFAIRGPGYVAGEDERVVSVQRLAAELFGGDSFEVLGPDDRTVAIDTRDGSVVVREMP
jgi:hypothetical protein